MYLCIHFNNFKISSTTLYILNIRIRHNILYNINDKKMLCGLSQYIILFLMLYEYSKWLKVTKAISKKDKIWLYSSIIWFELILVLLIYNILYIYKS